MASRKHVAWGPIVLGYIIGSFFSMFQLWAWAKGMLGGRKGSKLAAA